MQRIIVSCQERNIQLPKLADKLDQAITASEPDVKKSKIIRILKFNFEFRV